MPAPSPEVMDRKLAFLRRFITDLAGRRRAPRVRLRPRSHKGDFATRDGWLGTVPMWFGRIEGRQGCSP